MMKTITRFISVNLTHAAAASTSRLNFNSRFRTPFPQIKQSINIPSQTLRSKSFCAMSGGVAAAEEVVVQYVVLRRDLIDTWPMGSVVTQGCHASVAAIWENKDDPITVSYCSPPNIDSMHKVTLEVKGETQLVKLSEKLKDGGVIHKVWIEQPENFPTCLATKPYPKSFVSPFVKNLKLCK